jgi:hypothetical protein
LFFPASYFPKTGFLKAHSTVIGLFCPLRALPHQKSNPRVPVPHFEKVIQIKTDYPVATAIGGQNGVNHAGKKAVTRQVRSRCRKAGRKERSTIPDEFISITGYKNRKYAMRLLNMPARAQALLFTQGGAVKLKPAKPKPVSRMGKKIYTDEVTAALRLIWTFFCYKCRKLLTPLMRWQMDSIALWPAFGITPAIREKPMSISPATIGLALKNDRTAPALRGKSLTKSAGLPFPLKEFYSDNDNGFISHAVTGWHRNPACPIPFTHSRDHRKNNNCFVEKKNGAVVREYTGCDRLGGMPSRPASPFQPSGLPVIMRRSADRTTVMRRKTCCEAPRHGRHGGLPYCLLIITSGESSHPIAPLGNLILSRFSLFVNLVPTYALFVRLPWIPPMKCPS